MLSVSAFFILGLAAPWWAAPLAIGLSFLTSYGLTRGDTPKELGVVTLCAIVGVSFTLFLLYHFEKTPASIGIATLTFFVFGFTGNWWLTYLTFTKRKRFEKPKRRNSLTETQNSGSSILVDQAREIPLGKTKK
jgi:hypothetical protein